MNAELLAVAAGSSFLAGIRLYAAVALLGLVARLGWLDLPGSLTALERPEVIGVAATLAVAEFVADKVPWFDSVWDGIGTFLRVPGGALLAAGALSDSGPAASVIAGLLGGTFALGVHGTKAATRVAVNHSPEPVSNWFLSLVEDLGVPAVIALMIFAPVVLVVLLGFAIYGIARLAKWATKRRRAATES